MSYVLIVEPEEQVYRKLKDLLSTVHGDVEYQLVMSPDDAVEVMKSKSVDVLVSEMEMDVISGKELFSLAEMISPDTVRVFMTPANKTNETVHFMNECKTHRVIITPVQLVQDIVEPVTACLNYKRLLDKKREEEDIVNDTLFETDEDYSRMESSYIENSMKYDNVVKAVDEMIQHNIELLNEEDECKKKLKSWYRWLLDTYVNILTLTNGDYVFCRNLLMNKFHSERLGQKFHMYQKEEFKIVPQRMNEITYMTMVLSNTFKTLFKKYDIKVMLEDTEKYYIIRYECDYAINRGRGNVIAYKEENETFRKYLKEATGKFVNVFSYKEVTLSKEDKFIVNIAVAK